MHDSVKIISKKPEINKKNLTSQRQKTNFSQSPNSSLDHILFLQKTIGNQAMQRMIKSGVIQTKLRIGQPNDIYEQEADRIAEEIGSSQWSVVNSQKEEIQRQVEEEEEKKREEELVQPKLETNVEHSIQRQAEEEKEEILQTKEMQSNILEVTPDFESRIHALKGGGQPLPKSIRAFFEPRFGYDFSQVRVHTDSEGAKLAKTLSAKAFTVGQDIVFGAGQYSPQTSVGKKLLAHELTHVVQQTYAPQGTYYNKIRGKTKRKTLAGSQAMISGYTNRLIIQLKRVYCSERTTITWDDFKKKAPKGASMDASTYSNITPYKWRPQQTIIDTGKDCKIGKRTNKEFQVTLFVTFNKRPKGYLDQIKSWAKGWVKKKGREAHCRSEILNPCKKYFNKKYKKIKKQCKTWSKKCVKAFMKRKISSYPILIDKETIEVKNKKECNAKLLTKCKEVLKKKIYYKYKIGPDEFKANNREECNTVLCEKCKDYYKKGSGKLLKHEQGHYNITCVMANKIKRALDAWAPKFSKEATECGKKRAIGKAKKAFNKQKPSPKETLKTVFKVGIDLWKMAQAAYDLDTNHGKNEGQQKAWTKKINANLPEYKIPIK